MKEGYTLEIIIERVLKQLYMYISFHDIPNKWNLSTHMIFVLNPKQMDHSLVLCLLRDGMEYLVTTNQIINEVI